MVGVIDENLLCACLEVLDAINNIEKPKPRLQQKSSSDFLGINELATAASAHSNTSTLFVDAGVGALATATSTNSGTDGKVIGAAVGAEDGANAAASKAGTPAPKAEVARDDSTDVFFE